MTDTNATPANIKLLTSETTLSTVKSELSKEGFIFPGGEEYLDWLIVDAVTEAEGELYFFDTISDRLLYRFLDYDLKEWISDSTPDIDDDLVSCYMADGLGALEAVRRTIVIEAASLIHVTLENIAKEEFGYDILD